jgi:hypothetical protein
VLLILNSRYLEVALDSINEPPVITNSPFACLCMVTDRSEAAWLEASISGTSGKLNTEQAVCSISLI